MAKASKAPAAPVQPAAPVTVDQRVEAKNKDKTLYGVIKSIRAGRAVMVLDGGKEQLSGPLAAFRPSTHPLPKDEPNLMDRWAVVKYKGLKVVDEPGGYNATITLDGVPVIQAYNQGTGGPDNFQPLKGQDYKVVKQLADDATAWAKLFTDGELSEATGFWVEWFVFQRKYGVLAKEYVAKHATSKKEQEEWAKQREERDKKEAEASAATMAKLGGKVVIDLIDHRAEAPKLSSRFKAEGGFIVDTTTGLAVKVPLFAYGDAVRVIAALFPDEPKPTVRYSGLETKRMVKASSIFQDDELDGFAVAAMDGWEVSGDRYQLVWYAENPEGGDSIRKVFAVEFAPDSEKVVRSGVDG